MEGFVDVDIHDETSKWTGICFCRGLGGKLSYIGNVNTTSAPAFLKEPKIFHVFEEMRH